MKMPPLSIIEDTVPPAEMLEDQAQSLAINLVVNHLRSVIKSDKLAKKFEEKVPCAKNAMTNKENVSIEEILKKQLSKGDAGKIINFKSYKISDMTKFNVEIIQELFISTLIFQMLK